MGACAPRFIYKQLGLWQVLDEYTLEIGWGTGVVQFPKYASAVRLEQEKHMILTAVKPAVKRHPNRSETWSG